MQWHLQPGRDAPTGLLRWSDTVVRIFLGIDKVDIVVPLDNKEKYRQVSEANDTVKQYALLYRGTAGLFFCRDKQMSGEVIALLADLKVVPKNF